MVLPSASSLERAMACTFSVLGPRVTEAPTVYTDKGDTFHDFIFAIGEGGLDREEALGRIPKDDPGLAVCENFEMENLPKGGSYECALAFDAFTLMARVLGTNISREYEKHGADRGVEFVGSADWCGVIDRDDEGGTTAIVLDWKTGWKLGRVIDSWQLKFLAFTLATVYGCDDARIAYVVPRDDGTVYWMYESLDVFQFAQIKAALVRLHLELKLGQERVAEGEHCRYCPSFQFCPAKTQLLREMVTMSSAPADYQLSLSPEGAAVAIKTLQRYDAMSKRLWTQLKAYAQEHSVYLGENQYYEWARGEPRESVANAVGALNYLRSKFGPEVADQAVSTSKSAIEDAVRDFARANKMPIGKTATAVLNILRKQGLVLAQAGKLDARVVTKTPALPAKTEE